MSKEHAEENLSTPSSQKVAPQSPNLTEGTTSSTQSSQPHSTPPQPGHDTAAAAASPIQPGEQEPRPGRDVIAEDTPPSTTDDPLQRPRQVIAVSASKGPAAFFNLARKFLVTDEMCDLSALEGAIVSAVDAAHLLERSKLASIVRVQTSYVTVEPKRRKQVPSPQLQSATPPHGPPPLSAGPQMQYGDPSQLSTPPARGRPQGGASGRELRRARIVITVKRTESYTQWLEDNPLQAIIAGDAGGSGDGDEKAAGTGKPQAQPPPPSS